MTPLSEDTTLIRDALAYVVELYDELNTENGAPTPGTQDAAVDFILADPELSRGVREWARRTRRDEATTAPPPAPALRRELPASASFPGSVMEVPSFECKDRN